jgi:hypothetical protein
MLHDIARLRALDQSAVVGTIAAYAYRDPALADIERAHQLAAAPRASAPR